MSVTTNSTSAKTGFASNKFLNTLRAVNVEAQGARNYADLGERVIMSGDKLRLLIESIGHLLEQCVQSHDNYSKQQWELLSHRTASEITATKRHELASKTLSQQDRTMLANMFRVLTAKNYCDDKALTQQLFVFFFALTTLQEIRAKFINGVEDNKEQLEEAAANLMDDGSNAVKTVSERISTREDYLTKIWNSVESRHMLLDQQALQMFLREKSRQYMTQFLDGVIDTTRYVELCCNAYLQFKPVVDPFVVALMHCNHQR